MLEAYDHLQAGDETDERHRVAGRIAARRGSGKAAFLDLVDRTGKIQLHARQDVLGEERYALLTSLDLGDLLGADGSAMRSRHGEVSLRVEDFQILGKALRPPPDKHHGLSDVETRYRHRELDLISSEESRRLFIDRARIISAVRAALDGDGFIEVETPVLQPLYGGAMARPFTTHHNALDRDLYLRIATELYLKRLIVGGLERVYELGKDFRNEGVSHKHNPEFTMVEWYEAYAGYEAAMERTEAIVRAAAAAVGYEGEPDLAAPWPRLGFVEAVREGTGIDLAAFPTAQGLATEVERRGLEIETKGKDLAWVAAGRRSARQVRRAETDQADVRGRLPEGALAAGAGAPRPAGRRRALRGLRRGDGDRQRLQRADRPRRAARALPRPGPDRHPQRRGGRDDALRRVISCRRSSRACRRPVASGSGSTGW